MPLDNNPLSYLGIRASTPGDVINANRAPSGTDVGYLLGTLWNYNNSGSFTTYELAGFTAGAAVWNLLGGGSSDVNTINTLPPTGGNITIAGTAAQIGVANAGSTVTLSLIGPYTPATYTAHGVLVGEGASSIAALAVGSTGQVLIGATGADPAFGALGVNSGLTAHGVLLGEGNSAIAATAVGATGTLLAGSTGADPAFTASPSVTGSITAGTGITSTTGNIVATAGAVNAGTSMTATLGAITATNGNLVLGTAGNKIVSTSVASTTTAGANSFGTVTLVNGTATVSTTAVTANSIIMLTRQSPGTTGANPLGMLSIGTIVAGTSFVINALTTANSTTNVASDVSSVGWMIIN